MRKRVLECHISPSSTKIIIVFLSTATLLVITSSQHKNYKLESGAQSSESSVPRMAILSNHD